jgi:tetratricopeptide (TPR) repeat protein
VDKARQSAVIELISIRKHSQALTLLRSELETNPDDYFSHYHSGTCLRFLGAIDEAIHHYSEAVRLMPSSGSAHMSLGVAYQLNGQFEAAISELHKAIELSPDLIEAYNSIGLTYRKMDQPRMALEWYEKGINRLWESVQHKVHELPSKCYRIEADGVRTVLPFVFSETQRLFKSNVLYSVLCNNAGICLQVLGEIAEARGRFEEAIDLTPDGYDYSDPVLNLKNLDE